jgi:hypothetical protein
MQRVLKSVTGVLAAWLASVAGGQVDRTARTQPGVPGHGGGCWCSTDAPTPAPDGTYATNTWPDGIVHYRFHASVTPAQQQVALAAMAELEAACDVHFVPWSGQAAVVEWQSIQFGNFSSSIGRSGGVQFVQISAWNWRVIVIHELGHALGLWHEMQRPDRSQWITVNYPNIAPALWFAFNTGGVPFGPYDFDSVMHYPRHLWTDNGLESISPLPEYREFGMLAGHFKHVDGTYLSNGDIQVLQSLYGGATRPGVFELVSPSHRTSVAVAWQPVFEWTPSAQAGDYELVVDDDPRFASPEIHVVVAGSSYAAPSQLPPSRVYFWKVWAVNGNGRTGAWPRPVRMFYTGDSAPQVLHVDDDAPAGGTGASWATAMRDLHEALTLAEGTGGLVSEVRVAQGVYRPDRGTGDRELSFPLVEGVTVRGGYAGIGAPDPDLRNPAIHVTTLTGDLAGDDQPGFVNNGENSFNVCYGEGLAQPAVLDGLTITGGNAAGAEGTDRLCGGGIHANDAPLQLIRCRIVGNSATQVGGGVLAYEGSHLNVKDCVFEGNRQVGSLEGVGFAGGGAVNVWGSDCVVERTVFRGNTAFSGGAACLTAATGEFRGCTFEDNTARLWGGGVALQNAAGRAPFSLDRCTFVGNSVASGAYPAGYGGALASHGYITTVTNCLFAGNTAAVGGGGVSNAMGGTVQLANCTLVSNTALSGAGGGIINTNGVFGSQPFGGPNTVTLANCIVRSNVGAQIFALGEVTNVTYCNIQGGWNGMGNIPDDPLFVNAPAGDYRLASGSPCIDSGSNLLVPSGVIADMDGAPRFVDYPGAPNVGVPGGAGGPRIVDMGAYERPCYADCNADGVLGLADFGCFQTKFALNDPYADCNADGILNLADFGCFQTKFALGCP